jgi:uracil-DNA glycosylase family 4
MKNQFEILNQEMRTCTRCRLSKHRQNVVPGEGSSNAEMLFIGEAPGKQEDNTGRPFVGRAGRLLDSLFAKIGIDRTTVFITSVIKCHPPNNRLPKSDELNVCVRSWMERQIELIDPKVIVLLGRVALKSMLNKTQVKEYAGQIVIKNDKKFFVTYHPAAALRDPKIKEKLEKDLFMLKKIMTNS